MLLKHLYLTHYCLTELWSSRHVGIILTPVLCKRHLCVLPKFFLCLSVLPVFACSSCVFVFFPFQHALPVFALLFLCFCFLSIPTCSSCVCAFYLCLCTVFVLCLSDHPVLVCSSCICMLFLCLSVLPVPTCSPCVCANLYPHSSTSPSFLPTAQTHTVSAACCL